LDAGLGESRLEREEWRMWEGREKDCSKGLGSRSKSERVCLTGSGGGFTSGEVAISPFLGGVEDMMMVMTTARRREEDLKKKVGSDDVYHFAGDIGTPSDDDTALGEE